LIHLNLICEGVVPKPIIMYAWYRNAAMLNMNVYIGLLWSLSREIWNYCTLKKQRLIKLPVLRNF